jgi:hypothetical protein
MHTAMFYLLSTADKSRKVTGLDPCRAIGTSTDLPIKKKSENSSKPTSNSRSSCTVARAEKAAKPMAHPKCSVLLLRRSTLAPRNASAFGESEKWFRIKHEQLSGR